MPTTATPPTTETFATADLMDTDEAMVSCGAQLRHYGGRRVFRGLVSTVRCHEDNGLVRSLVTEPGHGRVLVVDGGGSLYTALVGDNVARTAADNGWAGIVVHGAVRDVADLRAIDIGVQALGTNPRRPGRCGAGSVGVPVAFGGVVFQPGMPFFSDEDGIVIHTGKDNS